MRPHVLAIAFLLVLRTAALPDDDATRSRVGSAAEVFQAVRANDLGTLRRLVSAGFANVKRQALDLRVTLRRFVREHRVCADAARAWRGSERERQRGVDALDLWCVQPRRVETADGQGRRRECHEQYPHDRYG